MRFTFDLEFDVLQGYLELAVIICWDVSLNLVSKMVPESYNGYPLNRVNILELSWHDMKKRIRKLRKMRMVSVLLCSI